MAGTESLPRAAVIGAALPRHEDERLLRGAGGYAGDIRLPDMLHAAVLRSPVAHARIRGIDTTAARALAQVEAVFTFDTLYDRLRPIPIRLCPDDSLKAFLQYPLANDRVRYVGEPVALVVAESRARAEDALARIDVDYEPLPVVTDALASPAAVLFKTAPDNVASRIRQSFGNITNAFSRADRIVRLRFDTGRHTAVPMETRGLLAAYDEPAGRLRIWGAAKVPHFNRSVLAGMLGWPEHRIHLVGTNIGGGFGVRGEFYPEDFLVPIAALSLHRPIKWIEDRLEHLLAANHSRQQSYQLQLAVRSDGTLLGLKADVVNDMGGYLRTHGTIVPGLSAGMLPGPYRFDAYDCEMRAVLTNKTPTGTYRAPGRFECNAARERLIDLAAAEVGMDPVDLRMKNLIRTDEMPYRRGTQILGEEVVFDSGDYAKALRQAVGVSDYHARRRPKPVNERFVRGVGVACYVEKTGTGPFEGARVRLDPSGEVEVVTGASNVGQGIETCLSQIAAEGLGLRAEHVTVRAGDTDLIPYGVGTFASRATVMAGNAVFGAARALHAQLIRRAAEWLSVAEDDIDLWDGEIRVRDGRSYPVSRLCTLRRLGHPDAGTTSALEETHYFHLNHMTYSHGATVVEVQVDTFTGAVKVEHVWLVCDVGRIVNPRLLAGQIEGGVGQGIGGALFEEFRYDAEGQLLTGSFQDYLLATAVETPPITHLCLQDSPSPLNPLGVKGAGEIGIAGIGGAVANAVADALGEKGHRVSRLPLTPERVWNWLSDARPTQGEEK